MLEMLSGVAIISYIILFIIGCSRIKKNGYQKDVSTIPISLCLFVGIAILNFITGGFFDFLTVSIALVGISALIVIILFWNNKKIMRTASIVFIIAIPLWVLSGIKNNRNSIKEDSGKTTENSSLTTKNNSPVSSDSGHTSTNSDSSNSNKIKKDYSVQFLKDRLAFEDFSVDPFTAKIEIVDNVPVLIFDFDWYNQSFPKTTTFLSAGSLDAFQGDTLLEQLDTTEGNMVREVAVGSAATVEVKFKLLNTEQPIKINFVDNQSGGQEVKSVTLTLESK